MDSSILIDLLKAFGFGATIAISVGPIALLIINNGIKYGYPTAIRSALGAATADGIFACIAFTFGIIILSLLSEYQSIIKAASSYVLIGFGLYMLRGLLPQSRCDSLLDDIPVVGGFKATFLLTIINPLTIIAFTAFIGQISEVRGYVFSLLAALILFLGSLIVQLGFAVFGVFLKRFLNDQKHIHYLQILSGVGIASFGIWGVVW